MTSDSDTQTGQLDQSAPTALHNSLIAYGLGSFGLEAAFKVFVGFYMFFYVDTLGLVIALAALLLSTGTIRRTPKIRQFSYIMVVCL